MAGAVDVETRGAIEASESDGGAAQADSAGTQGVAWDHTAFPEGKVVGEVGLRRVISLPYSSELNPAERVLKEVRR